MLNYLLEDQERDISLKTKRIIKQSISKTRKYQPFHIDCEYSNKKICYCKINPICNMSDQQKKQLWATYQKPLQFYQNIPPKSIQIANQIYQRCINKIRHFDKAEVISFVKQLKKAKLSNSTNESYQINNDNYYN